MDKNKRWTGFQSLARTFQNKRQRDRHCAGLLVVGLICNISWLAKLCVFCCCTCLLFSCVSKVFGSLVVDNMSRQAILTVLASDCYSQAIAALLSFVQVMLAWHAAVLSCVQPLCKLWQLLQDMLPSFVGSLHVYHALLQKPGIYTTEVLQSKK